MRPRTRPFEDRDTEAVVGFSLRAWAPAFASLEQTLGSEIFRRQHPDWREDQRRAVEDACALQPVEKVDVGLIDVPKQDQNESEIGTKQGPQPLRQVPERGTRGFFNTLGRF